MATDDTTPKYVSRAVVLARFGISEPTLRRWRNEKLIDAIRTGKEPVWETVKEGKTKVQKFRGAGHWRYDMTSFLAKFARDADGKLAPTGTPRKPKKPDKD